MTSFSAGIGKCALNNLPVFILKRSRTDSEGNINSKSDKKNVHFNPKQQEHLYFVDQSTQKSQTRKPQNRTTLGNISNQITTNNHIQTKRKIIAQQFKSPAKSFLKTNNHSPILEVDELADSQVVCQKFQEIFSSLDTKKVGYVDKTNCNIEHLADNLRYLIGGVVSKIRYQGIRLTKDEFIKQGKKEINGMGENQVKQLLESEPLKTNKNFLHIQTQSKRLQPKSSSNSTVRLQGSVISSSKFSSCKQSKITKRSQAQSVYKKYKHCSKNQSIQICEVI